MNYLIKAVNKNPFCSSFTFLSSKAFTERYFDVHLHQKNQLCENEFPLSLRRLHPIQKQINPPPGSKIYKYARQHRDFRGPEDVNSNLLFSQYGIQSLEGGELKFGHFELMRLTINKKLDEKCMFAFWRVPPPWKPKSKQSLGKRMGGGKADIHHYVTPIKEGRILLELGGNLNWQTAYRILSRVADKMPTPCRFVSQDLLDIENKINDYIKNNNVNPISKMIQHVMLENYNGCNQFLSPWHYDWKNPKYIK